MKKLVLVLGIATLFSCEKEGNKVCDCTLTWEQKRDERGLSINSANKNLDAEWHWEIIQVYPTEKDLCSRAVDWQYHYSESSTDRQRYICK